MCSRGRFVILALVLTVLGAFLVSVAQAADLFAVSRTAVGFNGGVKRFDGTTGAFISDFVAPGSGDLQDPLDLDFGPDGNLYVGDAAAGSVKRYNGTTGEYIDDFITGIGSSGPNSIQFGPDGNLYVQPYMAPWVVKYDGLTGANLGNFCVIGYGGIRDFTWTPTDDMLVMSPGANKVFRFAPDGTALAEYALAGAATGGRFAVCASSAGDIFVAAMNNHSIEKYDSSGVYVSDIVPANSGDLMFPTRVRIGPDGNLYVSSYADTNIKKYDISTGAYLGDFVTGLMDGAWGFRWQVPNVPKPSIAGTVTLADYTGAADLVRTKVELLKNSAVVSTKWLDGGSGSFEFIVLERSGQYQVKVSACEWVPQTFTATLGETGKTDLGAITLSNGDVDGNGVINAEDLKIVLKSL